MNLYKLGLLLLVIIIASTRVNAQTWPAGVHDPSSIIKDGNTYWVFATSEGIYTKYSTDMVTWTDGPKPFQNGEFPEWILKYAKTTTDEFEGFFWAPDIIFMNNQYYLYYSCSIWGTMNSCIGCVVNKTLNPNSPDYEWKDQGDIGVYSPDFSSGGSGWDVNAIDPAMMRGADNKIWMIYGSFNKGGIMITEVDSVSGKPIGKRTSIANSWTGSGYGEGEGACMFYHEDYYYLIYNKGGCCNGIASNYNMVIGRSLNPRGAFFDKSGKPMRTEGVPSGGTAFFKHDDARGADDRYYGPGHFGLYRENGIDYVSFHYYSQNGYYPSEEANYKGAPTLGLGKLKWGEDGWPELSFNFIDDGVYSITNSNSNKAMDLQHHSIKNNAFLWQYSNDSTLDSQKWLFTSLGTGEYTIRNYADIKLYVEAIGTDNSELLRVTTDYKEKINQKFRIVKGADNRIMIYPSIKDNVFEIPFSFTSDYQIKLSANADRASQRWNFNTHDIDFSVDANDINIGPNDTVIGDLLILGDGLWSVKFEDESWLEATPASGEGEAFLSVHALANQTDSSRNNKIFIHSHGGLTDTVLVTQTADSGTSIFINQNSEYNIQVYPNPATGTIFVNVKQNAVMNIYNSIGHKILSQDIDGSTNVIDISGLKSGFYVFEIGIKDKMIKKMVIKL